MVQSFFSIDLTGSNSPTVDVVIPEHLRDLLNKLKILNTYVIIVMLIRDIGINSLRLVRRIIIASIGHVSLVEGVLELIYRSGLEYTNNWFATYYNIECRNDNYDGFESSNKNKNMKNTLYYYCDGHLE
ncbi:unnamed protein product [Rhizophagus irregularis]|nr:unnamed protein product [Rhizophagus irregularis]